MTDEITDTSLGPTESDLEDTSVASMEGNGGGYLDDTGTTLRPRSPVFPNRDFTQLMDGLNKYPAWTVYPDSLGKCIASTTAILRQGFRVTTLERNLITKLIREAVPSAFEKCVEESCQSRWPENIQIDILVAGMQLLDLVIQRLQDMLALQSQAGTPEDLASYEEDLLSLLEALHRLCDPSLPFHITNRDADLPQARVEEFASDYALPSCPPAAESLSDSPSEVEEINVPQHVWLSNLLNAFGHKDGFDFICKVLSMKEVTYCLVDALLAPILKGMAFLTQATLEMFVEPVQALLQRMEAHLVLNPELLTDGGRDRMFTSASSALARMNRLLATALNVQEADQLVGHVQRQLVLCLLGQSSFSKHLTAVRETNLLLKRAVDIRDADQGHSMKVNVEWLRENDIVKQLLRANLHQKQYVDQVQKVLKNLTIEGGLQEDHLELLWNLTEKVDTFEAVKNNVYAMLGDLAQDFNGNQMDLLFNKFEACSNLSRQTDVVKVMNLVCQLAVSDSKGALAGRILGLLWEMVMNPEAPPELSRSGGLVDAIAHYGSDYAWDYMQRCVERVAANDNAPTALHMLRRMWEPPHNGPLPQAGMLDQKRLQELDDLCHLQDKVVSSFEAFMGGVVEAEAADPLVHTTEVGHGRLHFQLMEYVSFLHIFVCSQSAVLPVQLYERLWHCWLQRPSTGWILDMGYNWFARCAASMTAANAASLLQSRITTLHPPLVRESAFTCFIHFFRQVGMAEGKLLHRPPEDKHPPPFLLEHHVVENLHLKGVEFLWRLALEAQDAKVAENASLTLVHLNMRLGPTLLQDCASVRGSTIMKLLEELAAADAGLQAARTPPSQQASGASPYTAGAEAHGLHAFRCLALLLELIGECQGKRMPARPAHAASFQGHTLRLEVQSQGKLPLGARSRLSTFNNAYVGQLRRQAAALLGTQPQHLRLLHGGRELNCDSKLLHEARLVDGHVLLATLCPQQLEWTLPADNSQQAYSSSPTGLLASKEGLYDILLRLADDTVMQEASIHAAQLLALLPTRADVHASIRDAIGQPSSASHLSAILRPAVVQDNPGIGGGHTHLLYLLEAITGVLFPMNSPDPKGASHLALQQAFVHSGCIPVVLDAVAIVMQNCQTDGQAAANAQHAVSPVEPGTIRNLNSACLVLMQQLLAVLGKPAAVKSEQAAPGLPAWTMQSKDLTMQTSPSRPASARPASPGKAAVAEAMLVDDQAPGFQDYEGKEDSTLVKMATFFLSVAHLSAGGWHHAADPLAPSPVLEDVMDDNSDISLHLDATSAIKELLDSSQALQGKLLASRAFTNGLKRALPHDLVTPLHEVVHREQLQKLLGGLVASACQFTARDEEDMRLEGKLRLIRSLARALGRSGFEDGRSGQPCALLVRSLLADFLFPEAWAQLVLAESPQVQPSVHRAAMQAAMMPRCNNSACRKAAFELLSEVMLMDPVALDEGVKLLSLMHFDPQRSCIFPLGTFNIGSLNNTRNVEGFVGLRNGSATCYMNAVFQQLFMCPGVRMAVLAEPEEMEEAARKDSLFYQMQATFAALALSRNQAFKPVGVWHAFKDYDGEPINVREHQDAQEFLTRLQDLVDQHLRDERRQPIMQAQFGGKVATTIVCRSVPYRSQKEEDFIQVGLDVRGKHDLGESLDFYVQSELMEGENQYLCEEAGRKVDAVKGMCFTDLPNTLCIHLKRFEYDYEQMTRWKIKDRFEFPLELNMYKYTKAAADAREAAEAAQNDEAQGAAEDGTSASAAAAAVEAAGTADCWYELRGIVVHSGTANAGHYYSYIKVRHEPGLSCGGQWFCFDDTSVEPWNIANLERDCFGGKHIPETGYYTKEVERPNSAYLLFYDRVTGQTPASTSSQEQVQDPRGRGGRLSVVPIPSVEESLPSIFNNVMAANLSAQTRMHLVDREFYTFLLHLFEADPAANPKVRRTEAASSPGARSPSSLPPTPANSENDTANAAASTGSPADATMAASSAVSNPVPADGATSPSRRILDIMLQFFLRVYLRSHGVLRQDQASWRGAMLSALQHDSYARRRFLEVVASPELPSGYLGPEPDAYGICLCNGYLLLCDQADVRHVVAELSAAALVGAASSDGGTPNLMALSQQGYSAQGGAEEQLSPVERAVDTLLARLKRGMRHEQSLGTSSTFGRHFMYPDVLTVLAEYVRVGFQQAAHLTRLAFLLPVVRAGEHCLELWRKNDIRVEDMLAYYHTCYHIGRRWDFLEEAPNPLKAGPLDLVAPPPKLELFQRVANNCSPRDLMSAASGEFIADEATRKLMKYLQWGNGQYSCAIISEVQWMLIKGHAEGVASLPLELADLVGVCDSLMAQRMLAVLKGVQRYRHTSPRSSHLLGLTPAMFGSMADWRRFTCLRFLIALAGVCPEAEAALLEQDLNWRSLVIWLQCRNVEFLNAGFPPNCPAIQPAWRTHMLATIQGWAHQHPLDNLDPDEADQADADHEAPQADVPQAAPAATTADDDADADTERAGEASPSSAASA
ncbi:hypothetical protein WJX73_003480 [Symbiochloris irregularis]|uniref:USP domain-containing protein n=1 Tax=Symbiochloris irregularis TaxID=706552 RepID=A0AAW1NXS7_9CHLO